MPGGIAPLTPGYMEWRNYIGANAPRTQQDYQAWLRSNNLSAQQFLDRYNQPGGVQPSDIINPLTGLTNPSPDLGSIPVPGGTAPTTGLGGIAGRVRDQLPVGGVPGLGMPQTPASAPLPSPEFSGPPAYTPPQIQMPDALPRRQPQGLGSMPMIRDQAMASVMAPFAMPNWGVPQVNPNYLTRQMPLPGGATPPDVMMQAPTGLGVLPPRRQIQPMPGDWSAGVPLTEMYV